MIPFEIEKLHVEHMYLKQVSSALGGMITVVDEAKSAAEGHEVFRKIKIPHVMARHWKKRYTTVKYLKPVLCAVTFYGDHVVALERHVLSNLGTKKSIGVMGNEVEWISDSEHNLDTIIMPLNAKNDFFFDGTFLYTVKDKDIAEAQRLSADGRFKAVRVDSIKLMHLSEKDKLHPESRTALSFTPVGGKAFLTPPIWKSMANIGAAQIKKGKSNETDDDEMEDYRWGELGKREENQFQFDAVDENLSVNLSFALKAAKILADEFGYDIIEPLCLDDLMIQMRTVNLPQIANEVKQTYDTGLPFTHAVAWLIGLVNRARSLESFMLLRTLLKHLTTKGVYRKGAFNASEIFKNPEVVDVPLLSIEQADVGAIDKDTNYQVNRIHRETAKAGGVDGWS